MLKLATDKLISFFKLDSSTSDLKALINDSKWF